MSRRATATEAEIKRAVRAVQDLGLSVTGVRFEDGRVTVEVGPGGTVATELKTDVNEWDEVLQ